MGACEGMTITDPALLMSVMEAREEVEAAGSDRAALQPLLDRVWGLHDDTVQASGGAGRGGAGLGWAAACCRWPCNLRCGLVGRGSGAPAIRS